MNLTAQIDGDIVVYRCAGAAQHNVYEIYNGEIVGDPIYACRYAKERDQFIEDNGIPDPVIDCVEVVEPESHALRNAKLMMESILQGTEADKFRLWLSPIKTYRDEIHPEYKAGRPPKPVHYNAVRNYLFNYWDAEWADGIEADDAISIECHRNPETIVVSNDKDLKQIPGRHYNPTVDENRFSIVEEDEADEALWMQCLAGDATDNVPGIPGVGKVKAAKLLASVDPRDWCSMCQMVYGEDVEFWFNYICVKLLTTLDERDYLMDIWNNLEWDE